MMNFSAANTCDLTQCAKASQLIITVLGQIKLDTVQGSESW